MTKKKNTRVFKGEAQPQRAYLYNADGRMKEVVGDRSKSEYKSVGGIQGLKEDEKKLLASSRTSLKEKDESTIGFRQDIIAWSAAMVFLAAMIGAMFGFGHLRGWDALSGHTHNDSLTSKDRFLPEPDGPAAGSWYYWQLPPSKANSLTRLYVWLCYIAHQLTIWATIYYAQKKKTNREIPGPKFSSKMIRIQWLPLILNLFFNILHIIQTHTSYDALAQDVTESSSQGAFIMYLMLILLMEYRDRGLLFGWPTVRNKDKISQKLRLSQGPGNLLRKYHGYAFAWATIYNLWYHPMENTWAHATGYAHIWLILVQGSLMYTNLHLNRYWRLVLESWPIIHGTVTAFQVDSPNLSEALWPMFCFGFLFLFVVTQLFGLPFWRKVPWWTRFIPFAVYMGVAVWFFSWIPDKKGRYYVRLSDITRIPLLEYILVILAWLVLEICIRIEKKASTNSANTTKPPSPAREVFFILCFMMVYILVVGVSYLIQALDWRPNNFILLGLVAVYIAVGACVGIIFTKLAVYWGTMPRETKSKADVGPAAVENAVFSISENM